MTITSQAERFQVSSVKTLYAGFSISQSAYLPVDTSRVTEKFLQELIRCHNEGIVEIKTVAVVDNHTWPTLDVEP